MTLKSTFTGAVIALTFALPSFADGIEVSDAYARSSNAMAGAAFMDVTNTTDMDDRLLAVASDVAARVELHTHLEQDGVMRMIHVEEGFEVPAGEAIHLMRGGKHVMFMGLNTTFNQGDMVTVTLIFEHAGEVVVEIPVDQERQDGLMMDGDMDGDEMDHSEMSN